jgi:hypothetical protein
MNTFVWFTYSENERMLIQSIRSVMENTRFPKRICIVVDTYNNCPPMSNGFMNQIAAMQDKYDVECLVTTSNFNRDTNLKGVECVKGMLEFYTRLSENSDVILKVDDDVILFKDNLINQFIFNPNYLSFGTAKMDGIYSFAYGMMYGIKKSLINSLNREVLHAGGMEKYIEAIVPPESPARKDYPEDKLFSAMIMSFTPQSERYWIPFTMLLHLGIGFLLRHKPQKKQKKYQQKL